MEINRYQTRKPKRLAVVTMGVKLGDETRGYTRFRFLSELLARVCPDRNRLRLFLTTGVMGGFTTFSTFSLETVNLFQAGRPWLAAANVLLSVVFCLAGAAAGKLCAARAA